MVIQFDGRGMDEFEIISQMKGPSHLDFVKENKIVKEIVYNIKEQGLPIFLKYVEQFDGVSYTNTDEMMVTKDEINKAYGETEPKLVEVIKKAKERIWNYHSKQKQNSWISFEDDSEIVLGQKLTPMEKVGIYVPGGRAAYPSSVLMNAIPARVAGVSEIIMATPPSAQGYINPYALIAADIVGIDKIYKMGGAQSIAAMAFGIDTIPKVDKITGPGNIYVTLAKKEVYGYVGIDMIAGPSEVVVVADESANPKYIAADLLSQAEHDPLATAILITDSLELAEDVGEEIKKQAVKLSKFEIIKSSLRDYGAIILVDNLDVGIKLANHIAPEHLELAVDNPFDLLGRVKHAGSIFLGHYSPEPLGDYMAGPNHILPTSGSAKFFSPLSVDDFIKKSSFISFSQKALSGLYEDVSRFARLEGLDAHARSVEVRFEEE